MAIIARIIQQIVLHVSAGGIGVVPQPGGIGAMVPQPGQGVGHVGDGSTVIVQQKISIQFQFQFILLFTMGNSFGLYTSNLQNNNITLYYFVTIKKYTKHYKPQAGYFNEFRTNNSACIWVSSLNNH